MRKALLYSVPILAVFLLSAIIALTGWLLGTPEGARWLVGRAARTAGVRLEIGGMEGTLWRGLRLSGVTLESPPMTIRIREMGFGWRPLVLLTGNIAIDRLDTSGVDILDRSPESREPVDLSWPIISGPAARLNGWISDLTLRELVYRRNGGEPLTLTSLTGRLDWRGGRSALTNLDLSSPQGRITGNAGISFRKPELDLFATVSPTQPMAGVSRLLLLCRITPEGGKEQATGTIRAVAVGASKRRFDLSARVGLSRREIDLREMILTEAGRKGRLTGAGTLSFARPDPAMAVRLKAEGVDLSRELPTMPPLSGQLDIAGDPNGYRGGFSLAATGRGWRAASLAGSLSGNRDGLALTITRGSCLGGSLGGSLKASWTKGLSLTGELRGRGMDPARIAPDWKGVVNLDMNGELRVPEEGPLYARVDARLLSSRLRERTLSGELAARATDGSFMLDRLLLRGRGFDVRAAGDLRSRISFTVRADDLGGLVPGAAGSLRVDGQVLQREGRIGGSVTGRAGKLRVESLRAGTASLVVSVGTARERPVRLRLDTRELEYAGFRTSTLNLDADGTPSRHRLNLDLNLPGAGLRTTLEGGYQASAWKGTITSLSGRDRVGPWRMERPAPLSVSSRWFILPAMVLTGVQGERLQLGGDLAFQPPSGRLNARWEHLNLARVAPWTGEGSVSGSSSGTVSISLPRGGAANVTANVGFSGTVAAGEHRVQFRSGTLRLETTGGEIRATASLDTAQDGRLAVSAVAHTPSGLSFPEQGTFEARLEEGHFRSIRPWLPAGLSLDGGLTVSSSGEWLPGSIFRLKGTATVGRGSLVRQQEGGVLRVSFQGAALAWDWRDEALGGSVSLDLAETGRVRSEFRIPLPARLPISVNPDGAVALNLDGRLHENGLLTALFPGMLQESKGELEVEARAGGTWRKPDLTGRVLLSGAGASLPRAGVTLSDVRVTARLERDTVLVDSWSARSGAGTITGSASLRLREWRPAEYRGTIRGENFRLIYLPELQVVGSPRLDFTGTRDKVTVRGDLVIPELLVTGSKTPTPVRPSDDVVVIDAPQPKSAPFPLATDIQIRVLFGDQVFVRAEGIDARMAGDVNLTMRSLDDIRARGEVRVVKGSYKAYGVNLEITKGRLVYVGGSVSRPNLDILALRTVGDVKAGIILGGNLRSPVIRLYSEPAMSESDIMGYIVLGHPLSGDQGHVGTVMEAAGLLLSAGQSAVLKEEITGRFGIDTFGVEPDKGDVTKSLLTVGKYLTPKLFISYGRSLFSPTSYLKARYNFSERWEVETWTGTESGVDLFYKIDFD